MTSKKTVIALSLIAIIGIFTISSAQTDISIAFYMVNGTTFELYPVTFGATAAEDGWLVMLLSTGPDHTIDPPVLEMFTANAGLPTDDDYIADPVQNQNSGSMYINSMAMMGVAGGYLGDWYILFPGPGVGVEPVINTGEWVYMRVFNAPTRQTATMYADQITPYVVPAGTGNAIEVYDIIVGDDFPLPVEMLSFTATPGNNFVNLEWETASETENHHFNLYRDEVKITEIATKAIGYQSSEPLNYSFKDNQVSNGVQYSYQLTAVDINGVESEILMEVESVTPAWDPDYVVTEYNLHQNYPNPFNPGTTIEFDVLESGNVYLSVFNIQGQEVAKLVDGEYRVGPLKHVAFWNAEELSSGIYFYQVRVNDFKATKKMVLVR